MHIGITGASGFLAQQIVRDALAHGHRVIPFSRRKGEPVTGCEPVRTFGPDIDLSGIEAIIHLAGESVLGLWTKQKRERILRSRIDGTRWIVDAIGKAPSRPSVLVSASGAAIYGNRGEETITESSATTSVGFLAEVANVWEAEGQKAEAAGTRYIPVRISLVFGKNGGAIPLIKNIFKSGLGGKLGSGKQWMSWIHLADIAALFLHALETESVHGPVNGASPNPIRNEEFTKVMGEILKRPTLFAAPEFALRLLPANEASLLLDSLRLIPEKAVQTGFSFRFPELRAALSDVLA
ncbi:MAG: TIGR01777 family oxidoreductase [Verrucomicrobia bacterium]|nr:TIGR01777 family oxidoreductase [Verrucomicrobiota bacterium]